MSQKRNIEPLTDRVKIRNAKYKKSMIVMKKAYELAILCNLKVNVTIFDSVKQELTEFATDTSFTLDDLIRMRNIDKTKKKDSEYNNGIDIRT